MTMTIVDGNEDTYAFSASFAQQQLWIFDQFQPASPAYNIPLTLRLFGPLEVGVLERSLGAIVQRHEVLRTTLAMAEGQLMQIVVPTLAVPLTPVDLQHLPASEREAAALDLVAAEARCPFDLARGPLIRATLVRLGVEEHILLLNLHHVTFDNWSIGVLNRELSALYAAFSDGRPSPLADLPIQYADFACWQRDLLHRDTVGPHRAYWREQLADAPAVLTLPFARPRPAVQTFEGAAHHFVVPRPLSEALAQVGRRAGATLFMVLLAAFQVLLARYNGEDDIVVGSPIAGRTNPETELLIGYFVNTVALRVDLSGDPTFHDALDRVRAVCLGAYDHQELPFEMVVEELQPERDPSCAPLFQVMFNLTNATAEDLDLAGLTLSALPVDTGTAKFDLTLTFAETSDGLDGLFEYSTALFDEGTIARMAAHYRTLLEGVVANPTEHLSRLPMLDEEERVRILDAWNNTAAPYPDDRCIHQLFEEQVARTPDRVAVVALDGEGLTYRELDGRANGLARHLRTWGVGPGTRVGVCAGRSPEMVVGLLGILKTGAAYVPLDPAYPAARLAYILDDARVAMVLTTRRLRDRLPARVAPTLYLDGDYAVGEGQAHGGDAGGVVRGGDTHGATTPHNPAYVIYTSGSTGQPKGVLGSHRGAVNRFAWMWRVFPFTLGEVCAHKTALGFVDAIWELWGPLLQGVCTVLLPDAVVADPRALVDALAAHGVTRLVMVPSLLRALLDGYPDLETRLPALRLWVSSGEALPSELARRFHEALPGRRLLNLYGSSEVAADATWHDTVEGLGVTVVPIGRPIANTRVYVLDRALQPVPVGVRGELHVGGVGVADGYLDRPALTAERFIPDPFGEEPGTRLYRTGDLASYRADGVLEYLGRLDDQVKIHGYRIEPGEVEATLRRHPAVQEAAVVAREDAPGDQRLVAYAMAKGAGAPTNSELRRFLEERLPAYMVPAMFVRLDALPLTPNGKVDRRALPPPVRYQPKAGGPSFVVPRDALECEMTQLWERMLGIHPIDITDNFFDLGGHSLLAIRLVAEIARVFDRRLPPGVLFEAGTVEQLVDWLRQPERARSALVTLQPRGSRPPLFCVHPYTGTVLYYRYLAQYLSPDQPVYGIEAQVADADAQQDLPRHIEDMAAEYVREIRAAQPEGPYFLIGYSAGGVFAFEIAQQLRAQGHKTGLLALLDTVCPAAALPPEGLLASVDSQLTFRWKVRNHARAWLQLGLQEKPAYALARARNVGRRAVNTSQRWCPGPLGRRGPRGNGGAPTQPRPVEEWNGILVPPSMALYPYVPRVYPGRVTIFLGRQSIYSTLGDADPRLGWGRLAAGGLDIVRVPGDHYTMVAEPAIVRHVAARLQALLRTAQESSDAGADRGPQRDGGIDAGLSAR